MYIDDIKITKNERDRDSETNNKNIGMVPVVYLLSS